jgi:hypothetical protein
MDCAHHLLDSDEMIFVLARLKPRLDHPVVRDTAERYHAATTAWFDAVLVDLYRPAGPAGCGRVTPLQEKLRHYLASKSAEQREDKYGARQSIWSGGTQTTSSAYAYDQLAVLPARRERPAPAVTKRFKSNGSLAVNLIPAACHSGNWKILAGSSRKSRSRRRRRVIAMT